MYEVQSEADLAKVQTKAVREKDLQKCTVDARPDGKDCAHCAGEVTTIRDRWRHDFQEGHVAVC